MKYLLPTIGTVAFLWPSPGQSQTVTVRDYRFGSGRIVDLMPAAAQAAVPQLPKNGKPQPIALAAGPQAKKPLPNEAKDDAERQARDALREAQHKMVSAIRALNPSYAIAPVIGNGAASAGSFYIRARAVPGDDPAVVNTPWLGLPPPRVSGRCGWHAFPSWLYSGTLQIEGGPPRHAVAVDEDELAAMRQEIRTLRDKLDKLTEKAPAK